MRANLGRPGVIGTVRGVIYIWLGQIAAGELELHIITGGGSNEDQLGETRGTSGGTGSRQKKKAKATGENTGSVSMMCEVWSVWLGCGHVSMIDMK